MNAMPIVVAGAGPGGLATAIGLHRIGREVIVVERADALRASGGGLTIQPNGMQSLDALGIAGHVADAGARVSSASIQRADGATLARLSADDTAQNGMPTIGIRRAGLATIMADELPAETIRYGAGVTDLQLADDHVDVVLTNGERLRADVLVAADGIHSVIRNRLHGDIAVRTANTTCWRGMAAMANPFGANRSVERWGTGQRFGIVPVGNDHTYWFATELHAEDRAEDRVPLEALCARFADFAAPVDELLAATDPDTITQTELGDIEPLDSWTLGRVTLLGDAAHAMTPNMGQGACQALEDAVVLADEIARHDDVRTALVEYERRRRQRTRRLRNQSRRIGDFAQRRRGTRRRNALVRLVPDAVASRVARSVWTTDLPRRVCGPAQTITPSS